MRHLRRLLARLPWVPDRGVDGQAAIEEPPPPSEPAIAATPGALPPPVRDRAPFAVLLLAAIGILWISRGVLGPFIVAAVLAYAFSPLVSAGQRRLRWPRIAVVGLGYAIAAAIVAVLVLVLADRVAREFQLLAGSGPDSLARTLRELVGSDKLAIGGQQIAVADIAREIQTRIGGLIASPGDALHIAGQVGEVGLQMILAVIVTFYFLVDGTMFMDRAIAILPAGHRARTTEVLARIHVILGKWLRGQLLLIALVAAVAYVGLGPVLHLPYALALAVLTGILEIIPLIGPLVATAIVAVDAFARDGAGLAAAVIVFYFVLRQVEDQVVMPVVIGRAVHLHPVVTIFAVLVGLSLYGILGGLLGVPVAAAINVVFRELYASPAEDAEPESTGT
ncbi:MAG TPA: AI-2E family transporter [Candidatus Limnocylindrales bacterium]|nr:AI-2E family transporter [Candidatus Limnocylindrales bacterium]